MNVHKVVVSLQYQLGAVKESEWQYTRLTLRDFLLKLRRYIMSFFFTLILISA